MRETHANADSLPAPLRDAILAELDPGETLRWCGTPDPRRAAWRAGRAGLAFTVIAALLGGMLLFGSWSTGRDLVAAGATRTSAGDTWVTVYVMGAIGLGVVFAGLAAPVGMGLAARRSASRTVYALTPTRIFSCEARPGGRATVTSVEPGHPLDIHRSDGADGRGDITLFPARSRSPGGMITLHGVADARAVERAIRATFNP